MRSVIFKAKEYVCDPMRTLVCVCAFEYAVSLDVLDHTYIYTCQQKKKLRRKRKPPSERIRRVINVHIKVHIYGERDQNFTLRVLKKNKSMDPPFSMKKQCLFLHFQNARWKYRFMPQTEQNTQAQWDSFYHIHDK